MSDDKMVNKIIENIENSLKDLEGENNAVTKDLTEDALLQTFENLIYYGMYEKLGNGETYSDEDLKKMYNVFAADEEFEKCEIIKRILDI